MGTTPKVDKARKIYDKKLSEYKGMRDKLKEKSEQKIKTKRKLNERPLNSDEQNISKKYSILNSIPEKKKTKKKKGRQLMNTASCINKNVGSYPRYGRPFKPVPTIQQLPDESDFRFLKRVKEVTKMVIDESQFQDKYSVNVTRNDVGEVVAVDKVPTVSSKERNKKKTIRKLEKRLRKLKRGKGNEDSIEDGDVHSRMKGEEGDDESDIDERERQLFKNEVVPFGERVNAPPTLDTEKLEKKVKSDKKLKSGTFLFYQNLEAETTKTTEKKGNKAKQVNMEMEREKAIFAYRQMKAKREEDASKNTSVKRLKKKRKIEPI